MPDENALRRWSYALSKRARRAMKRVLRPGWMRALDRLNADPASPLLDPQGPPVTLTSFGERVNRVHYTIESIAAGRLRPCCITLWLDPSLLSRPLPEALRRLQARGLQVRAGEDLGPHSKYIHEVMAAPTESRPFVTADDDQLYPRHWLRALYDAWQAQPAVLHCFRAHRIALTATGRLAPYLDWPGCRSMAPSHLHFATGVSGVIYPPAMRGILQRAGHGFLDCCPRADDIWLNVQALRAGFPVRQLTPLPTAFYELPGTREQALARANNAGGGNDRQLSVTYQQADLEKLRRLS